MSVKVLFIFCVGYFRKDVYVGCEQSLKFQKRNVVVDEWYVAENSNWGYFWDILRS